MRKKRNPLPLILAVIAIAAVAVYFIFFSGDAGGPTGKITLSEGAKLVTYDCRAGETKEMMGAEVSLKGFEEIGGELACKGVVEYKAGEELQICGQIEILVFPKTKEISCKPVLKHDKCINYCKTLEDVMSAGSIEEYLKGMTSDPDCYMLTDKQRTEDFGDHNETLSFVGKTQLEGRTYCYSTITSEPDVMDCGIIELYANPFTAEIECRYSGDGAPDCDARCEALESGIKDAFCEGLGDIAGYVDACGQANF